MRRSFCSRSSSKITGSRRTAKSWYDCHRTGQCWQTGALRTVWITHLGSRIPVMVGIKVMFCNFIGVFFADFPLRHLLTNARIQLTELRSLSNLVPGLVEVLCSLDCSPSCGCPDRQGFESTINFPLVNHCLHLIFPVLDQALGHSLRIVFSLLG